MSLVGFQSIANAQPLGVYSRNQSVLEFRPIEHVGKKRLGFFRKGSAVYLNGHAGTRKRQLNWHSYRGWWFPSAAFTLSALSGVTTKGSIKRNRDVRAQQRNSILKYEHIQWCLSNFPDYRVWDNSFKKNGTTRDQCRGPKR